MNRFKSQKYFATITLGAWMAFIVACTEQPKQKDMASANAVTASSVGVLEKGGSSSSAQITLSAEEGSEVPDTDLQLSQLEVVADTVSYGSGRFCFEGRGENIDLMSYQNDIEKLLVDSEIPENSRIKEVRVELSPNLDKDLILGKERCSLRARDHKGKIVVKVDHDLKIDSAKAYLLRLKYKFEKRHDEYGRCHAHIKIRLDSIEKRKSECEKEEKLSEHRGRGEHHHRHHLNWPENYHGNSESHRQDYDHASDKRKQYGPFGHKQRHHGHHDDDDDESEHSEDETEDICKPIEVITPPNPNPGPTPVPEPGPAPMPPVSGDPSLPSTPTTPVESTTTTTMAVPSTPTTPVESTTTTTMAVPSTPTTPVDSSSTMGGASTPTTTTMPPANPLPPTNFDSFF